MQGDEPFIHPDQIKALCSLFERYPDTDIATLVRPLPSDTPYSRLADPALVKAVTSTDGQALYFSRFPVPFQRGIPEENGRPASLPGAYRHIRLPRPRCFGASRGCRRLLSKRPRAWSSCVGWQAGLRIRTAESEHRTIGIDTPGDLAEAEAFLR